MKEPEARWIIGLLVLLTLAVGVNIALTLKAGGTLKCEPPRPSLPCAAVPVAFVNEYPECADHLLQAMNVTNVHVQRFNGTLPGDEILDNPIVATWRAQRARANATT